jgi:hypothetical protein
MAGYVTLKTIETPTMQASLGIESGFYYSGKGIALSVIKNKFDFGTTTFHIFNF